MYGIRQHYCQQLVELTSGHVNKFQNDDALTTSALLLTADAKHDIRKRCVPIYQNDVGMNTSSFLLSADEQYPIPTAAFYLNETISFIFNTTGSSIQQMVIQSQAIPHNATTGLFIDWFFCCDWFSQNNSVSHSVNQQLMPPRRRGRARGKIPVESEGQNEEVDRSIPLRRRARQVEDEVDEFPARVDDMDLVMARFQQMNPQTFNEGLQSRRSRVRPQVVQGNHPVVSGVQPSQTSQSSQPPQQEAQQSGRHRKKCSDFKIYGNDNRRSRCQVPFHIGRVSSRPDFGCPFILSYMLKTEFRRNLIKCNGT
ncbi:hypothetical protein F511_19710 [Dorcoceras hygrometricum]|uniref:Uncharacterized protein n=1 Tax=Dorcoceras hygrometricum TaxID=472368 RepID=A0A2Z7AMW7_9LAMI|nr:hypothetical protein F511_19710 [Dorcoceras hygrometricum]